MPRRRYRALVFAGGGVRGFAGLGVAHELARGLEPAEAYAGTSSGALIAAALAIGRSPRAVLRRMMRIADDAPHVLSGASEIDFDALLGDGFGLRTGDDVRREVILRAVLGGRRRTFGEVWRERRVKLVVCATDLTTRRATYFGPDTHPDMHVDVALSMSCAIPLYFCAVRHGPHVCVDGALTDNFPVRAVHAAGTATLGVRYSDAAGGGDGGGGGGGDGGARTPVRDLAEFAAALAECAVREAPPPSPDEGVDVLDVRTPAAVGGALALGAATSDVMAREFEAGRRAARAFLAATAATTPADTATAAATGSPG